MSSHQSSSLEARTLLSGLVIGESPRWHEHRLWFAHWGTGEIVAVDLEGRSEVVGQGPPGLGWSIDWLPDGRLLVTGAGLMRLEPDGSLVAHADLSGLGVDGCNEIVVDGRGNVYVNGGVEFDPAAGNAPAQERFPCHPLDRRTSSRRGATPRTGPLQADLDWSHSRLRRAPIRPRAR